MGLGLSLAHSLVEAHGGRLVVSSEQGKGSTFTILIPLKSKGKDWKVMDPLNTILPEASSEAPETSPVSPKREEPEMSPVLDNPNNAQRQVAGPRPAARGGLPALSRTRQSMDIRKPTRRKESLRGAMRHSRDGETIRDNLLVEWLKSRKQEALSCMIRTELADKLTEMEALVVDDKQVNQVVIGELLSSSGFKVTPVLSGEEVLSLLVNRYASTGTKDFPDLIIMDLMAPGMNGNQVTGQIRTLYPQCPVPIIMVGSNIDQDSIVEALQVGCTDYITKPIQPTELLARVGLQLDVLHQDTLNLEAKRREALLQELLPESVIQRLKDGEELVVDELKEVTILHADVPDFDQLMAEAEGKDGFIVIDNLVKRLDALVELHGMYKVEANGERPVRMLCLPHASPRDPPPLSRSKFVALTKTTGSFERQRPDGF